jgi:hypothetical protein
MNKKILIEEIQRMRSMMGLSENFIPKKLILEGAGDMWKLLKAFVEGDDAYRKTFLQGLGTGTPERKVFDDFFNKYKGSIDPSGTIRSIDDLTNVARAAQLVEFAKAIARTTGTELSTILAKNGINFASDFTELNKLSSAAAGTKEEAAIVGIRNADPNAGMVLTKIKDGKLDELDIMEIMGVWNKATDLSKTSTDVELKSLFGKMSDDLEKAINEKELLDNIKVGNEKFADDIDFAKDLKLVDMTYERLMQMDDLQLTKELEDVKMSRDANPTKAPSIEEITIINTAYARGLITEDEMSMLLTKMKASTWKQYFKFGQESYNALFSADGLKKLKQESTDRASLAQGKYGNDRTKWPTELRGEIEEMEAIVADDFNAWLKAKALTSPETWGGFTSKYPFFSLKNLGADTLSGAYQRFFTGWNPFSAKLSEKQRNTVFINWGLRALGLTSVGFIRDILTGFKLILETLGYETGISVEFLQDNIYVWSQETSPKVSSISGTDTDTCEGKTLPWCGAGISKEDIAVIDPSLNLFVCRQKLMSDASAGVSQGGAFNVYRFIINQFNPIKGGGVNPVTATFYTDRVAALKLDYLESLGNETKAKINEALDKFGIEKIGLKTVKEGNKIVNKTVNRLDTTAVVNPIVSGSGKLIIKGTDGKQDNAKTNEKVLEVLKTTFGAENVGEVKVTNVVDNGNEEYNITLSNGKGGIYKYDGTKLTKKQ